MATKLHTITITRTFNAPRELVWKMFTDPKHLKNWYSPKGFTTPDCKVDFRVGGKTLISMQSPELNQGKKVFSTGTYKEIKPMDRIVVTDSFADEKGNIVPAEHYGMTPGFPLELKVTMLFEDVKSKTKFTLIHEGHPAGEMFEGAKQGWTQMFDKLDEYLAKAKK